jgi:hypothetical protein
VSGKVLNFRVILKFRMKFINISVLHWPVGFGNFTAVDTKLQPSRFGITTTLSLGSMDGLTITESLINFIRDLNGRYMTRI